MSNDQVDHVELTIEVVFKSGKRLRSKFFNVEGFQNKTEGNHLHWEGDLHPALWETP